MSSLLPMRCALGGLTGSGGEGGGRGYLPALAFTSRLRRGPVPAAPRSAPAAVPLPKLQQGVVRPLQGPEGARSIEDGGGGPWVGGPGRRGAEGRCLERSGRPRERGESWIRP